MSNLTPTQFALVQRVYLESLDLASVERDAFVRDQLGSEPELMNAYRALPEPTSIPTAFLEPGALGVNAASHYRSAVDDASKWTDPQRIGPDIGRFHLLSLLGEGGFGVVYEAEQTAPVRRRVALKIIKPGMDSRAVINRFEAERQALALMDHPCIAKVLDGGTTGAESGHPGLPFFAMELVRGDPITTFCDRERLTIEQRITLMASVCDAVQHAHLKGIIHRDIKPSNVLVTFQDGKPTPKIIDFGIAKAIGHGLSENTLFTQRGQLIGTPAYMSPEQAEMSGVDIDTRTDVYSLGVLLYEVLTSTPPFDPAALRSAGYVEMVRIIREVEPPRPSTRLSTGARSGATAIDAAKVAHARRAELGSLTRQLRTDLDWVVMKCLQKERDHRYMTAGELAGDLRRILAHEPVLAGPPSRLYRTRKFVRRHRVSMSWAALLAIVAGGLATLNVVQWMEVQQLQSKRDEAGASVVQLAVDAVAYSRAAGQSSPDAEAVLVELFKSYMQQLELTRANPEAGYRFVASNARTLLEQSVPSAPPRALQHMQSLLVHATMLHSLRSSGPGLSELAGEAYQKVIDIGLSFPLPDRSTDMTLALAQGYMGLADVQRADDTRGAEASIEAAIRIVKDVPAAELMSRGDILSRRMEMDRDLAVTQLRQCKIDAVREPLNRNVADRRAAFIAAERGTQEEVEALRALTVGMLTRVDLLWFSGDAAAARDEAEEVISLRQQALDMLHRLSDFETKPLWLRSLSRDTSTARMILIPVLLELGDIEAARMHIDAVLPPLVADQVANPSDARAMMTLIEAEVLAAQIELAGGEAAAALAAVERADAMLAQLLAASPSHARADDLGLKVNLVMGRSLGSQSQFGPAVAALSDAADAADRLIVQDPARAEYARLGVAALQALATTQLDAADASPTDAPAARAAAAAALAKAQQILDAWQNAGGLCGLPLSVREGLETASARLP